jgi:hypothetical protein
MGSLSLAGAVAELGPSRSVDSEARLASSSSEELRLPEMANTYQVHVIIHSVAGVSTCDSSSLKPNFEWQWEDLRHNAGDLVLSNGFTLAPYDWLNR